MWQNVKPADSVNVSRRFCSVSCSVHTTGEGAKPLRKKNCRFGSNSWPRSSGRHRQTDALLIRHMLTFYDRIQLVLVHVHWESVMVSWHSLLLVVHRFFFSPGITHRRQDPQIPSGIDVDVKYDVDYLFWFPICFNFDQRLQVVTKLAI